ncbi:MAG: hypothetical protein AAF513_03875 [Pseudomonadota bacterium]
MTDLYIPTKTDAGYRLRVTRGATVGPEGNKFLMGGVNFAAALEALEVATQAPVLYASAQFLSFARLDDVVDIAPTLLSEGKSVTQASAVNRVGEREILRVSAALGARDTDEARQFLVMPGVPGPAECPIVTKDRDADDLSAHIEKRLCVEDPKTGLGIQWIRYLPAAPLRIGLIALIADHLAGALPRTRGAASLDNHLRVMHRPRTEWILCETQMSAYLQGFMHGQTRMFAQDGSLIAIASQSAALPRRGGGWAQSQAREA